MKALIGKSITGWERIAAGTASRIRNQFYKLRGMQIEGYVWLRKIHVPRQHGDVRLGKGVALDEGVVLIASGSLRQGKINIRNAVYVNRGTIIDAAESIVIGEDTMIGPNCYITDHDHDYPCGTAPAQGGLVNTPTKIGNRVWLGAFVTILKGVEIGDDAIVGAGSVVTRSIPPRCIALGSPAKVVRGRDD